MNLNLKFSPKCGEDDGEGADEVDDDADCDE